MLHYHKYSVWLETRRMPNQLFTMFLAFLCILLISEITSSPVHQNLEKEFKSKSQGTGIEFNSVLEKIIFNEVKQKGSRRRRDDQPVKINVDDPLMKKHVQMVIDDFGSPNLPDMKGIIVDIADAAMFPSSDKLLYEIKLKVGSTKCRKNSDERNCQYNPETGFNECEMKIFRKTIEPSYDILCFGVGRKRRGNDDKSQAADLPIKMSIDDPEVKKYIDMAVDRHVSSVTIARDKKSILKEFIEATAYPHSGKHLYKIKLRIGSTNCTRGSEEQDCKYNSAMGYDDCEIDVLRDTDKEPFLICSRIYRID